MNDAVKKLGHNYPNHPEDNRLVKCTGEDWSKFTCIGMFIPYKKPQKKKGFIGLSRFCVAMENGCFESDRETWLDVISWEYVKEEPRHDSD